MKKINTLVLILVTVLTLQSCHTAKVLNSWKAEGSVVDLFKTKNVLVIGRTANTQGRIAFEVEIANALRAKGVKKVTESYTRAPEIHPEVEMSEERVAFLKSILDSEGYNAIVITSIKDKKQTITESSNGVYMGMGMGYGYPGYYGGFYDYYRAPYAYGGYYGSFGGYIPTSTSTYVSTDYVLETVAYNLDEPADKQLVAVVTTELDDPNDAQKAAEKLIPKIVYSLNE
ncbi:hypothetical protein Q4566_14350 [Tamlana sp. 2_MG-2023]|uniref:hypothetical protein n=1 Tax=unclassified Tamlana TaxID=2614803 RepID=UPI0026E2EFE3|nr:MULTISPECIES: hypothetical protein [unclassified Tamlana]MDO6761390.1 hypothetical protein [Tamlana sp. 2_MG-2023]MDO6791996.1 hypothetical protein [Tamlana sp. 1_MG-2023]